MTEEENADYISTRVSYHEHVTVCLQLASSAALAHCPKSRLTPIGRCLAGARGHGCCHCGRRWQRCFSFCVRCGSRKVPCRRAQCRKQGAAEHDGCPAKCQRRWLGGRSRQPGAACAHIPLASARMASAAACACCCHCARTVARMAAVRRAVHHVAASRGRRRPRGSSITAAIGSAKSRVPLLRPRSHGSATLIFSAFSLLAQNTGSTSKFEIVGLI